MKKTFIVIALLFIIVFCSLTSKSQPDNPDILKKNTFYLELGGNAVLYSINYDRLFKITDKIKISTRLGYGYSENFNNNGLKVNMIPFEVSGLFSSPRNKHYFEIGSGITIMNGTIFEKNHKETALALALRVGYRFQKPNGGMFYKIGFTPLYDFYTNNPAYYIDYNKWLLFAGIAIGYTF